MNQILMRIERIAESIERDAVSQQNKARAQEIKYLVQQALSLGLRVGSKSTT